MRLNASKTAGHLACAGAYIIFGLNIVFCKDIANSDVISPIALFSLRALGASALFWLVSAFLPQEKVERSDFPKIALASFLGLFLTQVSFLVGIRMVTSIDCSIMGTLGPVITMLIAAIFIKEPVTWKKALGVCTSLAGVIFLILNSITAGNGAAQTRPLGIVMMLVNISSFSAYLGIFKPLISKYSVVTFMKWMFLFSLLMSLPFSLKGLLEVDYLHIPKNVALEIGFLIFFATFVAYFLIPFGQKRIRPTLVSMYNYIQPILAVVVSICIGMDKLSADKVIAIAFVVAGVLIVNRSRSAQTQ